jgi:hypothetical protein
LPHPITGKLRDKIFVELIEADVEIGFGLVDEAKAYRSSGRAELAMRVLQDAAVVFADIESRLAQLGASGSSPFKSLVTELRNEIAGAAREASEDEC